MQAIIKNGGKQYKVQEGDIICFDKLGLDPKATVVFDQVLAVDGKIGTPTVAGSKVEGEVINEGKDRKVIAFKKKRRQDSKRKVGFRREFTRVRITKIS
ncbi:MAG: 50S ribosomal protein L21 [Campylobacterota bacterium]